MKNIKTYNTGEIVSLKKKHPCGSFQFEIIRTGSDVRIKCILCQHQITISKDKFIKSIKKT